MECCKLVNNISYQEQCNDIFNDLFADISKDKLTKKLKRIDYNVLKNMNKELIKYIKCNFK